MPAPIDLSAALGSPGPESTPTPAPGGGTDYFNDPLAGLSPAPGEEPEGEGELSDDPGMEMCQELFPDWTPDMHQKLLDLIDARLGEKPGDEADDMEPDADADEDEG